MDFKLSNKKMKVMVIGGGGYVGSRLCNHLAGKGHEVYCYDLFIFGKDVFENIYLQNKKILPILGDIRNIKNLKGHFKNIDVVFHLAGVSNDPSFDLNPSLGKAINFDSFEPIVRSSAEAGVKRFIFASSSSVYGVSDLARVTETTPLNPLTDYSYYKAKCESLLSKYSSDAFTTCSVRPATICGYSMRQRLDVIVNILVNHAYHKRAVKVFGGEQYRPNLHIADMVNFYEKLLDIEPKKINNKVFNVGHDNHKVIDLAEMVKEEVGTDVQIERSETEDARSYRIDSTLAKNDLAFTPQYSVRQAIQELVTAFENKRIVDTFANPNFYNIQTFKNIELQSV